MRTRREKETLQALRVQYRAEALHEHFSYERFIQRMFGKKRHFGCTDHPDVVITCAWTRSDHYKRRPL
ncbi:hypothetical protein AVEN_239781-1 [Araneus ventricosus]|uniref:Uncharacterized protein n=1 Tax=Araneus ventricosus TaxID=182803 RepID=A0A4Y2EWJ4_ARAVE|nr:hypothetical protein AVEN_239781-1 [Araneus ventricosus]